jgi:hypothetical protein
MEDLWLPATFQRHLEGIQAEHRVKAVGDLPAEYMPGEEIHGPHQGLEVFLEWDVGDVGRLELIHGRDKIEIPQSLLLAAQLLFEESFRPSDAANRAA